MDLKDFINSKADSNLFRLRIIPNAKNTDFMGLMDNGVIKIRITSIPEKGKANKALIDYLSKTLNIKKTNIEIASGLTDKNKVVKIDFC